MSSPKFALLALLAVFLSGCSMFNPYIDRRRNPGVQDLRFLYSGPSTPEKPVICYNPLVTDETKLQQMADEECRKQQTGNKAEFVEKTYFDGKLFLPNHAHYKCVD